MNHLIYVNNDQKEIAQFILNAIDAGHISHENNIIYDIRFHTLDTVVLTLGQLYIDDHNFLYYKKIAITYLWLNGEIGAKLFCEDLEQQETSISYHPRCHESLREIHREYIGSKFWFFTKSDFDDCLIADMP